MVFEHTINRLSFGYVRLPQLEYHFSSFMFFFFLLRLSTFKSFNALYSKFEQLKISRKTIVCHRNWECQVGRIPLNRALQSFELLNRKI